MWPHVGGWTRESSFARLALCGQPRSQRGRLPVPRLPLFGRHQRPVLQQCCRRVLQDCHHSDVPLVRCDSQRPQRTFVVPLYTRLSLGMLFVLPQAGATSDRYQGCRTFRRYAARSAPRQRRVKPNKSRARYPARSSSCVPLWDSAGQIKRGSSPRFSDRREVHLHAGRAQASKTVDARG